jgi:Concanavalin A-like lectin/glucanases superfamily/Family of unknown function (DUF6298)
MTVRSSLAVCLAILTGFTGCGIFTAGPAPVQTSAAVLRINPANPRYLMDSSGNTVVLIGNIGPGYTNGYDVTADINSTLSSNQNSFRLWVWEHSRSNAGTDMSSPLAFLRTGPGTANDGQPKFDLTKYDPNFFNALRNAVSAAGSRGVYPGVMLFQGWSVNGDTSDNPFFGHPFNANNNINGINADSNGDGIGYEVHTLDNPAVTAIQDAYIRKVIDTLNDLDNFYWEVCNECFNGSSDWQNHVANVIRSYEATKPKQHLIEISTGGGGNGPLYSSPADIIAQGSASFNDTNDQFAANPPPATGNKVWISDSDHIGWEMYKASAGVGIRWVWANFTRGYNLMGPVQAVPAIINTLPSSDAANMYTMMNAKSLAAAYAKKMNIAAMTPRGDLSSTGFALANPGSEYLVYAPGGGSVTVNLSGASGSFAVEWGNPSSGATSAGNSVTGGSSISLSPPFGGDAVLYLKSGTSVNPNPTPTPPPALQAGLVGWWKFDEGSGNTLNDSSGNGHNGTIVNNFGWTAGRYGGALSFSGNASLDGTVRTNNPTYIDLGSSSLTGGGPGTTFTIAVWVKVRFPNKEESVIISNANAAGDTIQYDLRQDGTKFAFHVQSGSSWMNEYIPINPSYVGQWVHLVWVNAGPGYSGQTLYLNGAPQPLTQNGGGNTSLSVPTSGYGNTVIGAPGSFYEEGSYFAGDMDDLRVYNRALSSSEVQVVYGAAGAP